MAQQQVFADYAVAVNTTADISNSTLVIPVSGLANWPNTAGGTIPFVATINRGKADQEKVLVASWTSTQINVVSGKRGYGGGTGQSHTSGATVEHTIDGGFLQDLSAQRFAVTTKGDIPYVGTTAGVQMARLAIGTAGQVLGVTAGGVPGWQSSMQTLLTATGDMVVSTAPGVPAALAPGTAGQVLVISGGVPAWGADTVAAGLVTSEQTRATAAEPAYFLTTTGDILIATSAGGPARLAVGSGRKVLGVSAGLPAWVRDTMTFIAKSADYNPAVDGDLVQMTGSHTVKLPNPGTAGTLIGVQAVSGQSGTAPVTITTVGGSGVFIGPGVAASATSILLGTVAAFVILEDDGTNWNIVGGAQDSGWVTGAGGAAGLTYRILGNRVTCEAVNAGVSNGAGLIAQVPAGYRPSRNQKLACQYGTGGFIQVATGGNMTLNAGSGNSNVDIAGLTWLVD